ncbi:TetR/AcrR family transcriptional regulator [Geothrix sp. 21YS21S-4]|uniref:TetR/AcrR family transcriptional regulator n=1 Tax=Geothrix sp. 21YS21S-4 TaxID=3068889 RepID=UPI0027BB201B|nr:TetR/AcrR family transcriptional regulator [Geothrix sp. 21YS21S-4]
MRPRDQAKIEKIRRCALELLVLEGFDGFSMQKLAKAAGVSPATLYIYFKDKEDLIFQLWQEQVTAWSELQLAGFVPEAPFEAELWRQWNNRVLFFQQHPLEWQFVQQVRHSPLHEKHMGRMPAALAEIAMTYVLEAIKRGELTDFGLGPSVHENFPRDLYWSLAYGPLYSMLRWVPDRSKPLHESPAQVDGLLIEKAFACVIKGLRP